MRIKRFMAPDMRTALRLVRQEQGEQAVILSSHRTQAGVEVVAATDYDEALVRQVMQPPAAAASSPPGKAEQPHLQTVPPVASVSRDPAIEGMRRELAGMRELIQGEMGRFNEERLRGVPVRAMALDELASYGCDRELARSIVASIPAYYGGARARGLMLGLLAKPLLTLAHEPIEDGGIVALVGPTGVGKTTTVVKLAARYAAAHSARDVALVTTDTGRVGGRAQLLTFGRQLGMPVFEPRGAKGLVETLDRLSDYPLVLIDTAGFGQRDQSLATQFNWMSASRRVRSYLVLPANAQAEDLDEVIRRFRCAAPEGVVLSKLDETGRLGNSLSVVIRHRLPLAYVTDGQNVPEDIHCAEAHRLVLRMGELRRDARKTTETAHAIA